MGQECFVQLVSSPRGELFVVVWVDVQIMKVGYTSGNNPKVERNQTASRQRQKVKEMILIMVNIQFYFEIWMHYLLILIPSF